MAGMTNTILVTGATGTTGSEVVRELAQLAGVEVRAGVRASREAAGLKSARVAPVDFDYEQPAVMASALRGVDRVFLLTPFVPNQVEITARFLGLAKAAGVKHVVKLSVLGAELEPGIMASRAHRAVEKLLESSGMAWTFLRPNNFMENFIGARHQVFAPDAEGNIRLPWGAGACSFIAVRDIAAVAALALTREGHAGRAHLLTGSEALTIRQVAEILTSETGRAIRYVDIPEATARDGMLAGGAPAPMVEGVLELHAFDKAGGGAITSSNVQDLLGRAPISFRDFAREHAAKWRLA
jgi:uncharacterized protein YbjT (DUF2867 family)